MNDGTRRVVWLRQKSCVVQVTGVDLRRKDLIPDLQFPIFLIFSVPGGTNKEKRDTSNKKQSTRKNFG